MAVVNVIKIKKNIYSFCYRYFIIFRLYPLLRILPKYISLNVLKKVHAASSYVHTVHRCFSVRCDERIIFTFVAVVAVIVVVSVIVLLHCDDNVSKYVNCSKTEDLFELTVRQRVLSNILKFRCIHNTQYTYSHSRYFNMFLNTIHFVERTVLAVDFLFFQFHGFRNDSIRISGRGWQVQEIQSMRNENNVLSVI